MARITLVCGDHVIVREDPRLVNPVLEPLEAMIIRGWPAGDRVQQPAELTP